MKKFLTSKYYTIMRISILVIFNLLLFLFCVMRVNDSFRESFYHLISQDSFAILIAFFGICMIIVEVFGEKYNKELTALNEIRPKNRKKLTFKQREICAGVIIIGFLIYSLYLIINEIIGISFLEPYVLVFIIIIIYLIIIKFDR